MSSAFWTLASHILRGLHKLAREMLLSVSPSGWRLVGISLLTVFLLRSLGLGVNKWTVALSVFFAASVTTSLVNYLFVFGATLPRDLRGLILLISIKWSSYRFMKNNSTIASTFRAFARKHPDKPCFLFEDTCWTFKQVDDYSDKVANIFWEEGFRPGDVVALLMESRPEYPCIWLGLSKIGVITALINFNLRQQPLVHSINTANAKAVLFGTEVTSAIKEISGSLPSDMLYFHSGGVTSEEIPSSSKALDDRIKSAPAKNSPRVDLKPTDRLVFIYTSGTTGLPKAAVITNIRYFFLSHSVCCAGRFKHDDVVYDALPLYHSAGGALGIGQAFTNGNTVAIRKKFSATKFWDDCIKYKCTIAQYIGEICRYLLAQPPKPEDKAHTVRLMFGNGVRPQIWQAFTDRFNVKQIMELYGATEGNANIINNENRVGAVGYLSRIAPFAYPCWLIKVDEKTGVPLRNKKGMAIFCKPGETGEFVGKILSAHPERSFDGYVSKAANEKKVIRDVWQKGDYVFSSGDLLVMDNFGYLYFKDRTGDTFRWKGENVSTAEVEAVISNTIGLRDSVVYGVVVPGAEGRAGMAAILDPDGSVNLDDLAHKLQISLPAYARPLFIRILDSLPMTGTYKLKKVELQEEGFDIYKIPEGNKLYYLKSNKYEMLDERAYKDILSGDIKL